MTIFGEEGQLVRSAVEGTVILRTIEAELDCVHSAHAQSKRRKADHYPDQYTGDEAPLEDYQCDTSERYVFEAREIPPRIEQPSIKQVQAAVEQQAAEDELRHVSEKAGAQGDRDGERRRHGRDPRVHGPPRVDPQKGSGRLRAAAGGQGSRYGGAVAAVVSAVAAGDLTTSEAAEVAKII